MAVDPSSLVPVSDLTPSGQPPARPSDQDITGYQRWLYDNPTDARAPKLRAKLRSWGVDAPDPPAPGVVGTLGDVSMATGQGFFVDAPRKAWGVLEHLPGSFGETARQQGSEFWQALPQPMRDYLQRMQEAGERKPWARTAGNVGAAALIPGAGESVAGNMAIGAGVGALQPLDPNDPNYNRDLAYQALTGGMTAGIFGPIAGRAATQAQTNMMRAEGQRVGQQLNQYIGQTPERVTQGMYQRIKNQMEQGVPGSSIGAPPTTGINAAADLQNFVGGRLTDLYRRSTFTPNKGWFDEVNRIKKDVGGFDNPDMEKAWNRVFSGDVFNTAVNMATDVPVTGERLNTFMSDLSARANQFGKAAQSDAVHANQYYDMANGLREIREAVVDQMAKANPAIATQLRSLNSAYHLSDVMVDATRNKVGGVASPADIQRAWTAKVGAKAYGADTKYRRLKGQIDQARETFEGRPGDPSGRPQVRITIPEQEKAALEARFGKLPARLGRGAVHFGAFEAARRMGVPWWQAAPVTIPLIEGATHLGGLGTSQTAKLAGRYPGAPAAAAAGLAGPTVGEVGGALGDLLNGSDE